MPILNDPVTTIIEDVFDKIKQPTTLIERYESAIYAETYAFLVSAFNDVSHKDAWWLTGVWNELQNHEQADDAYIGRLLRLYVKRRVRHLAELQKDGDTPNGRTENL